MIYILGIKEKTVYPIHVGSQRKVGIDIYDAIMTIEFLNFANDEVIPTDIYLISTTKHQLKLLCFSTLHEDDISLLLKYFRKVDRREGFKSEVVLPDHLDEEFIDAIQKTIPGISVRTQTFFVHGGRK